LFGVRHDGRESETRGTSAWKPEGAEQPNGAQVIVGTFPYFARSPARSRHLLAETQRELKGPARIVGTVGSCPTLRQIATKGEGFEPKRGIIRSRPADP
jgi:hypothetical protein